MKALRSRGPNEVVSSHPTTWGTHGQIEVVWSYVGIVRGYPCFLLFAIALVDVLDRYFCYVVWCYVVWWLLVIDCRAHKNFSAEYLSKYSPLLSFQVSLSKYKSSRLNVVLDFGFLVLFILFRFKIFFFKI